MLSVEVPSRLGSLVWSDDVEKSNLLSLLLHIFKKLGIQTYGIWRNSGSSLVKCSGWFSISGVDVQYCSWNQTYLKRKRYTSYHHIISDLRWLFMFALSLQRLHLSAYIYYQSRRCITSIRFFLLYPLQLLNAWRNMGVHKFITNFSERNGFWVAIC